MSPRPLLLLAVLLVGLLGLKTLSLADGAVDLFIERALAAPDEPGEPDLQSEASEAEEGEQSPADTAPAEAGSQEDRARPSPPAIERRSNIPTASQLSLETDLARRREELSARAEALDTREQLLAVAETRYNERLSELQRLREEIQGLLDELGDRRDDEIGNIVNTYGQLEPDAAASILQAMGESDPDTLLLVAGKLQQDNPRRFAAVMAEMQPGFAASLTSRLRSRAAPDPGALETEARNVAAGEG